MSANKANEIKLLGCLICLIRNGSAPAKLHVCRRMQTLPIETNCCIDALLCVDVCLSDCKFTLIE